MSSIKEKILRPIKRACAALKSNGEADKRLAFIDRDSEGRIALFTVSGSGKDLAKVHGFYSYTKAKSTAQWNHYELVAKEEFFKQNPQIKKD